MTADAPGLKIVRRKGGIAYYWQASRISRLAHGYAPKTVRLHGATDDERAARCRVLTAELREWLSDQGRDRQFFDGTIASLIRCYQTDEDSPYRRVRQNTRAEYDYSLGILENTVGKRRIDALTAKDIHRWYRNFRAPAKPGEPERVRRAQGCMKALRIIAGYGKSMRYPDCRDLADVLSEMRFEHPARREQALSYEQASAIVGKAIERGLISLALAQALQFECSLRQVDVIGKWEDDDGSGGIVFRRHRWSGGVTWSDVSPDLILAKRTTKNATRGEWDLRRAPLVMLALQHIPQEARIGPMIVSEATGRPYLPNYYQKAWRALARECGVPDDVWNRDSRAGGITEGDLAGADPRDLQKLATHSDIKTTGRYIRSTTRAATDKVLDMRAKRREK